MLDQKKNVVKYYNQLGSRLGYDFAMRGSQHFGFYPDSEPNISEWMAQENMNNMVGIKLGLSSVDSVLDAGCGQGFVASWLANKYDCQIWGITIVPLEVEKANKRAINCGVSDKTKFQLMDYSNTEFADNSFDAIYTTETLMHSSDIRKTLKEFYRLLKPGGRIALFEYTIADLDKFNSWERKMLDLSIEGSALQGLYEFKHNKFCETLLETGFVNATEENITKNVRQSWLRLHNLASAPYKLIRWLGLQKYFVNITAGYECFKFIDRDLYRYCIFTAEK